MVALLNRSPESRPAGRMPSIYEALRATGHDRARKLEALVEDAVRSHEWYYEECARSWGFYYGDHYGYWDASTDSWVRTPKAVASHVRLVVNLCEPIVDQATSILIQGGMNIGAVAASSEGKDSAASEAGDQILEHAWRFHGLDDLYYRTARAGVVTGTGITHLQWDMTRGRHVTRGIRGLGPDDEMPDDPLMQLLGAVPDVGPEGDAVFESLHAEEVVPEPNMRAPHKGMWIAVRKEISRTDLGEQFPQIFSDDDQTGVSADPYGSEKMSRVRQLSQNNGNTGSYQYDRYPRESVLVYTFYLRSSAEFPKGKMFIFADGKELFEGDNPVYDDEESWPNRMAPITFYRHKPRDNCIWGRGTVSGLIDLQKALNGTFSKAVQHVAKIAGAKVMLPKGLDVKWSDETGQVIRVPRQIQPGQIGYVNPANMPPEYMQLVDKAQEKMEYNAGINAATQGTVDQGDPSGRALQLLQQRDTGRLADAKKRLDGSIAVQMQYFLLLFRRHASTPRKILVVGANGVTAIKEFDRSSLVAGTDVLVFNDQSIPKNPSERILYVTNMVMNGLLDMTQPAQKELAMELLRLRDFKGFLEQQSPHRTKALRENRKLMLGEPVQLWQYDDHIQHIDTLEKLMLSEEFEQRVAQEFEQLGDSPTLAAAQQHHDQHVYLRDTAQLQMQQMQDPAAMAGPPGPAPAEPAPPTAPEAAPMETVAA
jgi:hypothetical protein